MISVIEAFTRLGNKWECSRIKIQCGKGRRYKCRYEEEYSFLYSMNRSNLP